MSFVDDPDDIEAWRAAIRPDTKALFAETLGNPRGNVLDIRAWRTSRTGRACR